MSRRDLNAFTMNCVSHIHHGQSAKPDTSSPETAGHHLGHAGLPPYEERYDRADEDLEVDYKLRSVPGPATQITDGQARTARCGRDGRDVVFCQGLSAIVGGIEEETRRKAREIDAHASEEGHTTSGLFDEFIDGVVPVSEDRGLVRRKYVSGTLREKLGGGGPRLDGHHPGAGSRRTAVRVAA